MKLFNRRPGKPAALAAALLLAVSLVLGSLPGIQVRAAGQALTADGPEVTWDFRDQSAPIYSGPDGSLTVAKMIYHDNQHGALVSDGAVLTLTVPAGQTTVTLPVCAYSNDAQATWSANGSSGQISLTGDRSNDTLTQSFTYTGDAAQMTITISGSGSIYLHYLTARTITPVETATVRGTVSLAGSGSVEGETLLFMDGEETAGQTVISNNTYTATLPVGRTYQVVFAQPDLYEITGGATVDLSSAGAGAEISNDIQAKVLWDTGKTFSFDINGTSYAVTPGNSSQTSFSVTSQGNGSVELATNNTAILWADLEGAGRGSLTDAMYTITGGNVTAGRSGNTLVFTYTDTTTGPLSYTVIVKDNSASGVPVADGETHTYDFTDGSVVSTLYTNGYTISGGASVPAQDGLLTLIGNNSIRYNDAAHGIAVSDRDTIQIKVAGNAQIDLELCQYSADDGSFSVSADNSGTLSTNSITAKAVADGDKASVTYTGEAATITLTYSGGSGYIHNISVTNQVPDAQTKPQEKEPASDGSGLTVQAVGQRLMLSQAGGDMTTGQVLQDNVGWYSFPETADMNRFEADIVVTDCGNTSANGVFFGVYDDTNHTNIAVAGIRNSTNLRGIYTRADGTIGAGGINADTAEGQVVHVSASKTSGGLVLTMTPQGGEAVSMTIPYNDSDYAVFAQDGENTQVRFGLLLANASATVTNMTYYNASGTVLYDQNDCYSPIGSAPVVRSVSAEAAATRDAIQVTWNSSVLASGDGYYVVEVSHDSGQWTEIAQTTENSFLYPITEGGLYQFRVSGRLGNSGTATEGQMSAVIDVMRALQTPQVSLNAGADSVAVSWSAVPEAERYEIYRYSSDEGVDNASVIYTALGDELQYTDVQVTAEVPYYYYVIAYSADNWSNPSPVVWALPSAGHTGDFLSPDEGAHIQLTRGAEGTVSSPELTIAGTADRSGSVAIFQGETLLDVQSVTAAADGNETGFSFDVTLPEGSSTWTLIHTDARGGQTRMTLNYVYLPVNSGTVDLIVDASYAGIDGAADASGIPVYKTVQAAVNAVPSDNDREKVIYIRSGSYNEQLTVSAPNITLIGEGADSTSIHCYPAALHGGDLDYAAGGDMALRCAVYIQSSAVNFRAENLTFANDYVYDSEDRSNQSADALRCDADGASFVNVTVSGVQDTLYLHAGQQTFTDCRIEGLIDFIYSGDDAQVLFNRCDIVFVYVPTHAQSGIICAPRTAADSDFGLVFYQCAVTAEEGCSGDAFRLARPWGPDGAIYWIDTYMSGIINAQEPYEDMSGNSYQEARFYEFGSYGAGYQINGLRPQISQTQANAVLGVFGLSDETWIPSIPAPPETEVPGESTGESETGTPEESTGESETEVPGESTDESETGAPGESAGESGTENSDTSADTAETENTGTSGSESESGMPGQSAQTGNGQSSDDSRETQAVKTGDTAPLMLCGIIMVFSVTAIAGIFLERFIKRQKR